MSMTLTEKGEIQRFILFNRISDFKKGISKYNTTLQAAESRVSIHYNYFPGPFYP